MEVVTVLSIIEAVISLTKKFRDLVIKAKIAEKDKDGFLGRVGELLDELRFSKDVDAQFEYFVGEQLDQWLSRLRRSRKIDTIESVWEQIYERFEKHIVQKVEKNLPRMKAVVSNQSKMELDKIPLDIRDEATRLTQLYPELIQLIEEFMKTVRKQYKEIKNKNFKNIGPIAKTLNLQIKRIKMRANAVLRDLCSIVIYVYGQSMGSMK